MWLCIDYTGVVGPPDKLGLEEQVGQICVQVDIFEAQTEQKVTVKGTVLLCFRTRGVGIFLFCFSCIWLLEPTPHFMLPSVAMVFVESS